MKKNFVKVLALLMALSMVLCLSACGDAKTGKIFVWRQLELCIFGA